MQRQRIVIIGAGVGGLTLAIALLQRGFSVRVHEQAAVLGELGAGLTLPATAMRVFDALGMWPKVRRICSRIGDMAFLHYRTLELLHGAYDSDWTRLPETPEDAGHTYRAALHALLVDEVRTLDPAALVLGHRLVDVVQTDRKVTATFANGDTAEGELLVAADGVRSAGYRAIFGGDNPAVFTGCIAIRCLIPRNDRVERFLSAGRAAKYVGPRRGFNRYGIRGGATINCVALARTDDWREEGWTHPCSRAEFLELYGDFHEDVTGLIRMAPEQDLFKWALYARPPLSSWTVGRATLLGDAAHPMLPYLGQGATAAIEDALVLARALDAHPDHVAAFSSYEAERRHRTEEQMRASEAQGEALNQDDPYRYATLRPSQDALRHYDPATVPV